jgi:hypothetical protein
MPRMEPSVVRRLENCSATDTIAIFQGQYLPTQNEWLGMPNRRNSNA